MDIPHRELATTQAARLVLDHLKTHQRDTPTPRQKLIEALIPVFGIRWGSQIIRRIGPIRLCDILWSLRNSKLPQSECNRVNELWHQGLATDNTPPNTSKTKWEARRALIERFNLDGEIPLAKWLVIVDVCVKQGWLGPSRLATADSLSFTTVVTAHSLDPLDIPLWEASVLVSTGISEGATIALKGASANAEQLIKRLKATSWVSSAVTKDASKPLRKPRLPKTFSQLSPAAKLNRLRLASVNQFKIRRVFRTDAQTNALIGERNFFGSFASSIRCYFSFCELMGIPPFPLRASAAIEWSSIFNPGATFANYANYLKKSCFPQDQTTSCVTPASINLVKGLKLEGGGSSASPIL